jgi:hypothetical protein
MGLDSRYTATSLIEQLADIAGIHQMYEMKSKVRIPGHTPPEIDGTPYDRPEAL